MKPPVKGLHQVKASLGEASSEGFTKGKSKGKKKSFGGPRVKEKPTAELQIILIIIRIIIILYYYY